MDWIQGILQAYQSYKGGSSGSGGGMGSYSPGSGDSQDSHTQSQGYAYGASPFDSSNWSVATGSAKVAATNAGAGLSSNTVLIALAIAALVIIKTKK